MRLEQGGTIGPYRFENIAQADMTAFAEILRDPNPIHLDAAVVRSLGLGDRTVNQGPANLGYILNMLMVAAPAARVTSIEVRFLDNLFQGETAVAGGAIEAIEQFDDGESVTCSVWLDVDQQRRVLAGTATFVVPSPAYEDDAA
jgi:3-hydroxybutyryl-CoA dehydratase